MRQLTIFTVLNGYVIQSDCQCVVFTDKTKMLSELSRYLDNPDEVSKEYLANPKNGYGKAKQMADVANVSEAPCEAPRQARTGLGEALARVR